MNSKVEQFGMSDQWQYHISHMAGMEHHVHACKICSIRLLDFAIQIHCHAFHTVYVKKTKTTLKEAPIESNWFGNTFM